MTAKRTQKGVEPSDRPEFKDQRRIGYQIRRAIQERSDLTHAQLGGKAGVDAAVISRFVAGKRGVTLDAAERLALALGLRIVPATKRKAPAAAQAGGTHDQDPKS